MRPKRICHVIGNLHYGGAEWMLYRLLSRLDAAEWQHQVISLMECGPVGEHIEQLGIPVYPLRMRRGFPGPLRVAKLYRLVRQQRPDVVQTWMYHADLLGGLAAKLHCRQIPAIWNVRNIPIVWNIRINLPQGGSRSWNTIWTAHACAWLSGRLPTRIVVNSQAGRQSHEALGYDGSRMRVIPNGFDLETFCPRPSAREQLREELGLSADALLVGLVARYHPQKDHPNFFRAATLIAEAVPNTHFVLCGRGTSPENQQLTAAVQQTGLSERFHLLGPRSDMPTIQASFDLAVSSSAAEGFPNAIGEAMACGVPCVVTDVGGSAELLGEAGIVVPPGDSRALAEACSDILNRSEDDRRQLGHLARQRTRNHFSMEVITRQYAALWRNLADGEPSPSVDKAA